MLPDETRFKRHIVMRTDNGFPIISEDDLIDATFKLAAYEKTGTPEQFEKTLKFYKNFCKWIDELEM